MPFRDGRAHNADAAFGSTDVGQLVLAPWTAGEAVHGGSVRECFPTTVP
jgi:hypothetical protein